ncbi:MAG: TlpA disulfide reductase family protein [Armatimonadota bacterium]
MKSTRVLFAVAAAIALILIFVILGQAAPKDKAAPNFKLTGIDGKKLSLDDIRKDPDKKGAKRVVLVNFWATWCPYCVKEMPTLESLHKKYGKKGLAVVGIALDSGSRADVKKFVKEKKLSYILLVDEKGVAKKQYGIRPIPVTVLVDKQGKVAETYVGYSKDLDKTLEKKIESLL